MHSNSFIFVVDKDTYETHRKYGFCAIGKSQKPISYEEFLKPDAQKGHHALLADILNIQVGDLVFFYVTKEGFKGIYEVTQQAFFDATQIESVPASRPFRVLIKPKYHFENAVPENNLFLNPERQQIFWIWYFNKMRMFARGCTPLDPDAKDKLIELLIKHNNGTTSLHYVREDYPGRNNLKEIRRLAIPYITVSQTIKSEDSLRAAIMQAFQEKSATASHIFGDFDRLEWFANQIPYHIAGNNIDVMLYHRSKSFDGIDARYQISVIELKKERASLDEFYQLIGYCQWVGDQLANQEHNLVQPVLLARAFDSRLFQLVNEDLRLPYKKPLLVEYHYDENGLRLEFSQQQALEEIQSVENTLDPERYQQVVKRRTRGKAKLPQPPSLQDEQAG
jgi:hypothetical protein